LQPLKPKIVEVDPNLIDELLREEHHLEKTKHERLSKKMSYSDANSNKGRTIKIL